MSSGTTALHLALLIVGVRPGDKVITVSHSYIATANVVRYCGAMPVFVDVRPDNFDIDPTWIEEVVTLRRRAILAAHQIGMPCEVEEILDIARRRGPLVVEDAACAVESEILSKGQWERIGRPHGDLAYFSLHHRKLVSTGYGGMITAANAEWDAALRLWRQHGLSVPDTTRHGSRQGIFTSYPLVGYRYRLTDIQAAVGREQLKRLPDAFEPRPHLARRYLDSLAGGPGSWTCRPAGRHCDCAARSCKRLVESKEGAGSRRHPAPLSRDDGGRPGSGHPGSVHHLLSLMPCARCPSGASWAIIDIVVTLNRFLR